MVLGEARNEVARRPTQLTKRLWVFKWIGALVVMLDEDQLGAHLDRLMLPLARETNTGKDAHVSELEGSLTPRAEFEFLTSQVLDLIKDRVGSELFSRAYSNAVTKITQVRIQRKSERKREVGFGG